MRDLIIDYLNSISLGAFSLANELPYSSSGTDLYVKNVKKIYVDRPQFNTDPIINTLQGATISNETTSIKIYFSCDAKQLPPSYEDLIVLLKLGKDYTGITGYSNRECLVSSEFIADQLVTELEYRFTKIT
jgi:hypothetical protein